MNNNCYICVWDCETSGLDPEQNEIVQIACIMIDPHTLEFVPDSEFNSLMKPVKIFTGTEAEINEKWNKCWKAWEVNKKTKEELQNAPLPEHVLKAFVNHVKKWSVGGFTGRPIPAGQNIKFDFGFLNKALKDHKLGDKNGDQAIFNNNFLLETMMLSFLWFDHVPNTPEKTSFDIIRPYLGVANDEYHDALQDCRFTGEYLIRFMKLHRKYSPKITFRNSFAKKT